ncbi:MAG: polysaccharide biosynthesis tyrosine autokinase [Bacteroidales bacterium]|nr:polysaccharide biosynthesis tyrosine autokinase [Bacteroidales bacterium]
MVNFKDINLQDNIENNDSTFDLTGLLLECLGQWKWFALSVVICLIFAYYHIATIIPVYQVNASIYLSGDDKVTNSSAVALSGEALLQAKTEIDETELEIMKSRNNVIKIVDSLNLSYSYYNLGRLRNVPIYGTEAIVARMDSVDLHNLSAGITIMCDQDDDGYEFDISTSYGGNEEHKKVHAAKLPIKVETSQGIVTLSQSKITTELSCTEKIEILNPQWVAARISGSLDIHYIENSWKIIAIIFRTPVIQEGIDVIRTLITFYNEDIIEQKNQSAMQTEAFFLDRLVMISGELKDVEQRLEDYRRANNIVNLDQQASMNLSRKSSSENELAQVTAQQQMVADVEKQIARQDNFTPVAAVVENTELNKQIEAYNKKLATAERLMSSSTDDNPMVKQMREDLNAQKSVLLQQVSSVKNNLNSRRNAIASVAGQSAGQLASLPPIDKGLQEIFREQQVKVNIYTFLLQKREEIALQKTLATPTARLIDNPSGFGPVYPQTTQIYGMALVIGLLVPALIIFLRRLIFPVFKDKDDIERVTKTPVVGEVCKAPKDHELLQPKDNSPEAELFRLLRNNIQFILGKEKQVMVVTSSLSGEGKTFVASNMALTFAMTGKKVLVIGLDIRRPVLAHSFNLHNRKGITTYLCGQTDDYNSLVQPSGINENLWILPAGPVPPNPNELLLSPRLDHLIDELRKEYDYVIIDSAPIGLVSDTLLISRVSDVQVYVVRANYSTHRCLRMMNQAIESGRFPNTYIVLNCVNIRSNAYRYRRYGYYGAYGSKKGYGYGYGGYAEETPTPASRLKKLWRKANKK